MRINYITCPMFLHFVNEFTITTLKRILLIGLANLKFINIYMKARYQGNERNRNFKVFMRLNSLGLADVIVRSAQRPDSLICCMHFVMQN